MQLNFDFQMKQKSEFVLDDPNVIFPQIPSRDDNTERPVEMCSLETYPLQNANGNNEAIIIANTRHIKINSERKIVPMLCEGDLDFFCNRLVALKNLRLWAHERTPGIPLTWKIWKQLSLKTLLVRLLKINT